MSLVFLLLSLPAADAGPTTTPEVFLDEVLAARIGGPGVLDVELGSAGPATRLFEDSELAWVRAHETRLREVALGRLARTGDALSALVLGELLEARALPHLRRWYVDSRDFYGWESDHPCALEAPNHPARHAYEQALGRLTKQPLELAVRPSATEFAALVARGDEGASYALFRLRPQALLPKVARAFRESRDEDERFRRALELEHLLTGQRRAALAALLGRPSRSGDAPSPRLEWDLVNPRGDPERLVVELDEAGGVRRARVVATP